MNVLESHIKKIIVHYGFTKRIKGYSFPCLVIPRPVMDTLCQRLARLVDRTEAAAISLTLDHKEKEVKP